ncbi:MAG: shikimate dehydrogenase [Anaerolineaceae bacterium]|nr:shikimate dehydrogenase [Anaerolineaceae bacterium]
MTPPAAPNPSFYFIGVTTQQSSMNRIFPLWMEILGRPDITLTGIDHAIHDDPQNYRDTVSRIKHDDSVVGGLVTTHKIDLFNAAEDLFDEVDAFAQVTREVSCIAKRDGKLIAYALDPISSGLTLTGIIGERYFGRTGGHVLCLGAGGSASAVMVHLLTRPHMADRPARFIAVDKSPQRLAHMRTIAAHYASDVQLETVLSTDANTNDDLLAALPPYSVVMNATGMGKDTPGSPLTDAAIFPQHGIVWEFNYRGERQFMQQALRQADARQLRVEDGWVYFIHGWTQVLFQALDMHMTPELFTALDEAASSIRG